MHGGAARGAYWLHLGLQELGIDSKVLTNSTFTLNDLSVISTTQSKKEIFFNFVRSQLDYFLIRLYFKRKRVAFSSAIIGIDLMNRDEYKEADIIHLHWLSGGFINIKDLAKVDKPIVWTIRDMWPISGGCHYSMGCEKYKTACGSCEQLGSYRTYDLSTFILNRKKKYLPKNMIIVGISRWISEEAKQSALFKGKNCTIQTIANTINLKEFFPIDKKEAREFLGIRTDKKILLVGSASLGDFYKGFTKYLEAIKTLDKNNYFLCFFGNLDPQFAYTLEYEYKSFGYVQDDSMLRLIYSCADVFIAPSLMDAFGKTLGESMACGTPVVCFNATGPKDIVTHKHDGYLAQPFDPMDLAYGIEWIINADNYDELCRNGREKVMHTFDALVIAKEYVALYKKVLNEST